MKPLQKKDIKVGDTLYTIDKNQKKITATTVTKVGTKYAYFGSLRYEYGSNNIEYLWDSKTWQTRFWLDEDVFTSESCALDKLERIRLMKIVESVFYSSYFSSKVSTETLRQIVSETNKEE
jgi:hypothetical protein